MNYTYKFDITLGRVYYNFQKYCNKLANDLDINISINRFPSLLTVTYFITLNSENYSNIILFLSSINKTWLSSNNIDNNEYEEC